MFTRAELAHKLKIRNAQLSLRVVVFSIVTIVPAWIAVYTAQRLGFARNLDQALRPAASALAVVYFVGVLRIFLRAAKEPEPACPNCKTSLNLSISKVLQTSTCPKCGARIVR